MRQWTFLEFFQKFNKYFRYYIPILTWIYTLLQAILPFTLKFIINGSCRLKFQGISLIHLINFNYVSSPFRIDVNISEDFFFSNAMGWG